MASAAGWVRGVVETSAGSALLILCALVGGVAQEELCLKGGTIGCLFGRIVRVVGVGKRGEVMGCGDRCDGEIGTRRVVDSLVGEVEVLVPRCDVPLGVGCRWLCRWRRDELRGLHVRCRCGQGYL